MLKPARILSAILVVAFATAATFAQDDAVHDRMKKDLFFLASKECEGRGVDTKGIHLAADYIVGQLKEAGLKPGGKDGTFFQPFTLNEGDGEVEGVNTLRLKGPMGQTVELRLDQDFAVLPLSANGKVTAPIVFAGYGVTATDADYDDYQNLDVKDKIVVVLRRVPRWENEANPFSGHKNTYAGLERKIGNGEANRAAAVIVVNDASESANGDKFMSEKGMLPAGIPVIQLRRSMLDTMLVSGKGVSLADLEKDIDRDLKPRSGPITGWTGTLTTTLKRPSYVCKNIIAVVEGKGPLANETVVIGAHYDHLGYGGRGSLAKDRNNKEIHPGADDNGSGTTTVIELARRFAAMKDRQGRRLVFMLFSGEERGLFGSKYYCTKDPIFPLENTVAMVNLDMVGRLNNDEPKLKVEGVGTGKGFKELVEKVNEEFKFEVKPINGGRGPSDHDSFCQRKIPVLFLWTGTHEDYHKPTDLPERINIPGMMKVASMTQKIIGQLSTDSRHDYVHIAETPLVIGKGGARLRIMPAYETEEGKKGVLVESVVENAAGAKGGIKTGDRIIAIGGQPTPNISAYMAVLERHKAGVPLEITIERKGEELRLKVIPE